MTRTVHTHVAIPPTAKMVREEYELVQFMDCYLYVLCLKTEMTRESVQKIFTQLMDERCNLINEYHVEFLDELPCMDCHPKLRTALQDGGYNLVMSMNEPGTVEGKQYLLMKTNEGSLYSDLASMLTVSEQITEKGVKKLMLLQALSSPEPFLKRISRAWESKRFLQNYFIRRFAGLLGGPVMALAPTFRGARKNFFSGEILTHRKKVELQDNFIKNLNALKENQHDAKAMAEVQMVLDSLDISNRDMIACLRDAPAILAEQMYNNLSPRKLAECSNLKMEIRNMKHGDIKRKTDGRYRLYLRKEDQEYQVQFSRQPSFIIYLIYLLDVVGSEVVDSINIKKYQSKFCRLFEMVYGEDGKADFRNLFGIGEAKQSLLRHCYSDICSSIGDACEILHEKSATPFVLQNSYSHLYIKKENIIIDKDLTDKNNSTIDE